jgi:hypothetical protein
VIFRFGFQFGSVDQSEVIVFPMLIDAFILIFCYLVFLSFAKLPHKNATSFLASSIKLVICDDFFHCNNLTLSCPNWFLPPITRYRVKFDKSD